MIRITRVIDQDQRYGYNKKCFGLFGKVHSTRIPDMYQIHSRISYYKDSTHVFCCLTSPYE